MIRSVRTCRDAAYFSMRSEHNAISPEDRPADSDFPRAAVRMNRRVSRFCLFFQCFPRVAQTTLLQRGYTLTELLVLVLYLACFVGLVALACGVIT